MYRYLCQSTRRAVCVGTNGWFSRDTLDTVRRKVVASIHERASLYIARLTGGTEGLEDGGEGSSAASTPSMWEWYDRYVSIRDVVGLGEDGGGDGEWDPDRGMGQGVKSEVGILGAAVAQVKSTRPSPFQRRRNMRTRKAVAEVLRERGSERWGVGDEVRGGDIEYSTIVDIGLGERTSLREQGQPQEGKVRIH